MTEFRLLARGPDRYCPDCGRWLVKIHEDGTFDLAAEAGIDQQATFTMSDTDPLPDEVEAFIIDAICLRCHPEPEPVVEAKEKLNMIQRLNRRFGR